MTDDYHDYVGTFEYWWTHALISDSTYRMLRVTCDVGSSEHPSLECMRALQIAATEQGNIDPYSIFTRPCNSTASLKRSLRGHYVSSDLTFDSLLRWCWDLSQCSLSSTYLLICEVSDASICISVCLSSTVYVITSSASICSS